MLNRDDESFEYLSGITQVPCLSYGLDERADVQAQDIEIAFSGLSFTAVGRDLDGGEFRLPVRSSLVGEYNVYNCLAALTLALGVMRLPPEAVSAGLAAMRSVPGRMELIQMGQPFTAIVDFAHTPNALIKSLEAARQLTSGRVIAVFGSAGLRDREKRRMMAEASAELADVSILTAEDPRTESLDGILAEMARRGALAGRRGRADLLARTRPAGGFAPGCAARQTRRSADRLREGARTIDVFRRRPNMPGTTG